MSECLDTICKDDKLWAWMRWSGVIKVTNMQTTQLWCATLQSHIETDRLEFIFLRNIKGWVNFKDISSALLLQKVLWLMSGTGYFLKLLTVAAWQLSCYTTHIFSESIVMFSPTFGLLHTICWNTFLTLTIKYKRFGETLLCMKTLQANVIAGSLLLQEL